MSALASIKAASGFNSVRIVTSLSAVAASDKLYAPDGLVAPGVQRYVDRSGADSVGWPSYTLGVRRPVNGSRVFRVTEKITLPVLNISSPSTGSGVQPLPSKAFELVCNREYVIPEGTTLAQRVVFAALCASFMATDVDASDGSPTETSGIPLYAAVMNLDSPY